MTALYIFDRGDEPLPETAAELLPPWRRERFQKLRNPAARQESLAAGLLWRLAMVRRGQDPAADVTVLPGGKPVLAGREELYFSLSHSGGYALCAVSGRSVGADVQKRRRVNLSMLRRFHPGERAWLEALAPAEAEREFFRLWTRKEAWVKAVSRERMLSLKETDVIHELPGWFFSDYDLPGGFQAALCAGDPAAEVLFSTREEILSPRP